MVPILQSVAQAKVIYPNEKWEIMMDNMAAVVFLGSGPQAKSTHEYISETLGNAKGQAATFPDPRTGVRAQIQHLKAYASKEALVNGCVDPRFSLVTRGSAQYVEWLGASDNPNGKGWAVPGKGYGSKIIALLGQIMAFEVPQTSAPSEPEEQEPEFPAYQLEGLETLTEAGVINSPEFWRQKFSEQVTVGEMFGILGKLFTKVTE